MLNDILQMLEREQVFALLGREKTQRLVLDIIKRAQDNDCNYGEILDNGVAERLGICRYCLKAGQGFQYGLCDECRKKEIDWWRKHCLDSLCRWHPQAGAKVRTAVNKCTDLPALKAVESHAAEWSLQDILRRLTGR
jgi:hypothetical protein